MKISKLGLDLIANYISFIILASCGVLINLIIVAAYNVNTLGQFNLLYSFYIFISQVAALGIHYSVLRSIAINNDEGASKYSLIIGSALVVVLLISLIIASIVSFSSSWLGLIYNEEYMVGGLKIIAYSLPFFALNKVFLAALNGDRHMVLFATGQSLRYLAMLFYIIFISLSSIDSSLLFYVFLFSESVVFIYLSLIVLKIYSIKMNSISREWLEYHLHFGIRAFCSGVFLEVNSRIDVIILALYATNSQVGVYSFAAMIAEGFSMMVVVIRNIINPSLASKIKTRNRAGLINYITSVRNYSYLGIGSFIILACIIYYIFARYFLSPEDFYLSCKVLAIFSICVFISSGYLPFTDYLTQAGYPFLQSIQNILVFFSNIVLVLILAPKFGVVGAAISAGLSTYILSILYIDQFLKQKNLPFLLISKRVKKLSNNLI